MSVQLAFRVATYIRLGCRAVLGLLNPCLLDAGGGGLLPQLSLGKLR